MNIIKIDYPAGTNSDENRIKALAKDKANLSKVTDIKFNILSPIIHTK